MKAEILFGNCIEVLKSLEADSFDSMCSDPPCGIAFMSATWDTYKHLDAFEDMLTEAFTHYVLDQGMTQDQAESFKSVLKAASIRELIQAAIRDQHASN